MAEIRLSKLIKKYNIGLQDIVVFLNKHGVDVGEDPNAKVSDDIIPTLELQFGRDRELRLAAEQIGLEQIDIINHRNQSIEQINALKYAVFDLEARKINDSICITEAAYVSDCEILVWFKDEPEEPLVNSVRTLSESSRASRLKSKQFIRVDGLDDFVTRLTSYPVIIGHNIKKWDIGTVLKEKKDSFNGSFILDTLVMQMILDPFQSCYALNNTLPYHHTALSDAVFNETLFWNQVLEISKEKNSWIKRILPNTITRLAEDVDPAIIKIKAGSKQYFKTNSNKGYSIPDISNKLSLYQSPLIIAPKSMWTILRRKYDLRFNDNGHLYKELNKELLPNEIVSDETAILHSISLSTRDSILICDLSPAVRSYFYDYEKEEDKLSPYFKDSVSGGMTCTDLAGFESIKNNTDTSYDGVFIIGKEIEARENTYDSKRVDMSKLTTSEYGLRRLKEFADSNTPRIITQDLYLQLTDQNVPEFTRNIWIEPIIESQELIVKSNLDMSKYELYLKERFANKVHIPTIKTTSNADCGIINLLISKKEELDIDCTWDNPQRKQRLTYTTKNRHSYWAYQLGMVLSLKPQKPIIWVIENEYEIGLLEDSVKKLGYYVPKGPSIHRRLELAHESNDREKSIIIIDQSEFVKKLLESDLNYAYCLVYNCINVDLKKIRWNGMLPFGDEPSSITPSPTEENILISSWPQLSLYANLVKTQHPDCDFYLVDPVLDCCSIQSLPSSKEVIITDKEFDEYRALLQTKGTQPEKKTIPDVDKEKAMDEMLLLFQATDPGVLEWNESQKIILPHVYEKKRNCLICMPTGGGKSALFQIPSLYRAKVSGKLSLVISPLKALLQDQVNKLDMPGVEFLNSDKSESEVEAIYQGIRGGTINLLYLTPERFRSQAFMNVLGYRLKENSGLEYIIFDEAHCISLWGLDFRPDYRYAARLSKEICRKFDGTRIELFTATVTKNVREDILSIIGEDIEEPGNNNSVNPVRDHIGMEFRLVHDESKQKKAGENELSEQEENRVELIYRDIEHSNFNPDTSSIIIFSTTQRQVESFKNRLAQKFACSEDTRLSSLTDKIAFFHGGMTSEERDEIYKGFKGNRKEGKKRKYCILVATKAFGMGMDIPDIHYVYHAFPPETIEDYLQEIGRAGRNKNLLPAKDDMGKSCHTVCFVSDEDIRRLKDLQIKDGLTWDDVKDIYSYVLEYKEKLSPDDNKFFSIPTNIWKRDGDNLGKNNESLFKVGLYWLSEAGRIETRFSQSSTYVFSMGKIHREVLDISDEASLEDYICYKLAKESSGKVQLSIREMKNRFNLSNSGLNDMILQLQEKGVIKLENKVFFRITNKYLSKKIIDDFCNNKMISDFYLPFEYCHKLVESINDSQLTKGQRENILRLVLGNNDSALGNYDLRKIETIAVKILSVLPHVNSIKIEEDDRWIFHYNKEVDGIGIQTQINRIREYTFRFCVYLYTVYQNEVNVPKENSNNKKALPSFTWTDAALNEIMGFKSYRSIKDTVELVKALGFAMIDPLMPKGIEVRLGKNRTELLPLSDELNTNSSQKENEFDLIIQDCLSKLDSLKQIKLICMMTLSKVKREHFDESIKGYFNCSNLEDFLRWNKDIIENGHVNDEDSKKIHESLFQYSAQAYTNIIKGLNLEQKTILDTDKDKDLIVMAGPGSGKTHILMVRCAKLMRMDKVNKEDILVLAYNRGVVNELKARLTNLFADLGFTRRMSRIRIMTFHSLTKYVERIIKAYLGEDKQILGKEVKNWENDLFTFLSDETNKKEFASALVHCNFRAKYILIDEFQDITEERLSILFSLRDVLSKIPGHGQPKFFVVGDINQSIYGYQRSKTTNPEPYYNELREHLHIKEGDDLKMTENYRSYQAILNKANQVLDTCSSHYQLDLKSALLEQRDDCIKEFEPEAKKTWDIDFNEIIHEMDERNLREIAFLYRNNPELYEAYHRLNTILSSPEWSNRKFNIRIQGDMKKFYRTRECYYAIHYLLRMPENSILGEKQFAAFLGMIHNMKQKEYLDKDAIDLTTVLALSCYDSLDGIPTSKALADEMLEAANTYANDLIKIKDEYRYDGRIIDYPLETTDDKEISIIFSTMHRVKGLEFEAVVVNPSENKIAATDDNNDRIIEEYDEERRLLYVCYTRAKKYLRIYKGHREKAILTKDYSKAYVPSKSITNRIMVGRDAENFKNLNKSFKIGDKDILSLPIAHLKKNTPVWIDDEKIIRTMDGNVEIGQLRGNITDKYKNISGLYINDIVIWRQEEAIESMDNYVNSKSTIDKWKKLDNPYDFNLIPIISGIGSPKKCKC